MRPSPSAIIARTTYLVSTIGETVLTRTSGLDLRDVHVGEQAVVPSAGVVDEPVEGADPRLQAAGQLGDRVHLGKVERRRN